jgi:hypothetical protein
MTGEKIEIVFLNQELSYVGTQMEIPATSG